MTVWHGAYLFVMLGLLCGTLCQGGCFRRGPHRRLQDRPVAFDRRRSSNVEGAAGQQ